MTTIAHSTLPWRVTSADGPDECYTCGIGSGAWIIADVLNTCSPDQPVDADHDLANANAEFIVRACNAHHGLIAALKLFLTCYPSAVAAMSDEQRSFIYAAIVKAEGR